MATEHMSLEEFKKLNDEREAKFKKKNRRTVRNPDAIFPTFLRDLNSTRLSPSQ